MTQRQLLTALLLTLCFISSAPAQTMMHIYRNGETTSYSVSDVQKITFSDVNSVKDLAKMDQIVKGFKLNSNFPNPFNPSTTINYQLNEPGLVQVRILDVTGREVAQLLSDNQMQGAYKITWNGITAKGLTAGAGVYFYQISVNDRMEARKMLLLK